MNQAGDNRAVGSQTAPASDIDAGIAILLFQIMGTRLGIETRQIARTTPLHAPPDPQDALHYFHDKVPFSGAVPAYRAPTILHPAAHLGVEGALIVDQLATIQTIHSRDIRRLPRWLAYTGQGNPYWGVALQADGLILLVDLAQVLGAGDGKQPGHRAVHPESSVLDSIQGGSFVI